MLNPDTGLDTDDPTLVAAALAFDHDPLGDLFALDDPLVQAAAVAFGRIVDEVATAEDLHAYRAWIVSLRLDGWSEDEVATSVAVADHLAAKLGL